MRRVCQQTRSKHTGGQQQNCNYCFDLLTHIEALLYRTRNQPWVRLQHRMYKCGAPFDRNVALTSFLFQFSLFSDALLRVLIKVLIECVQCMGANPSTTRWRLRQRQGPKDRRVKHEGPKWVGSLGEDVPLLTSYRAGERCKLPQLGQGRSSSYLAI